MQGMGNFSSFLFSGDKMLDKSIPYKNIFMEIFPDKINETCEPPLPDGFRFRFFADGDESHWARIESAVLEFDSAEKAGSYFTQNYLPFADLLKKRCVFIVNAQDIPVATATAWFANSIAGYQPSLHWVAVHPDYQGAGLGKAIIQKTLKIFSEIDRGKSVMLHTQTWSHKAVKIYSDLGFVMLPDSDAAIRNTDKNKPASSNDFQEALQILREKLDEKTYRKLKNDFREKHNNQN